jgi:hypothetical protein
MPVASLAENYVGLPLDRNDFHSGRDSIVIKAHFAKVRGWPTPIATVPPSRDMPSALCGEEKCHDLHRIVDEMNYITRHQRSGTCSHDS